MCVFVCVRERLNLLLDMEVSFIFLSFPIGSLYRNFSNAKTLGRSSSPFVMRVSGDEMDAFESEDEEVQDKNYVAFNRFNFDELDLRCSNKFPLIGFAFCFS